jgi:phage protein U
MKTTLYTLGSLTFEQLPFSLTAVVASRAADWAAKDVLGTMRPREFTGLGDERLEFTGRLFPQTFADNKNSRDLLDQMRRSSSPFHLMRGDGANMGWYVIESVTEEESYLDRKGRGKLVDYRLMLVRVPVPQPESYIQTLQRLFA